MRFKETLAVILAVTSVGATSVTALAASADAGQDAKADRVINVVSQDTYDRMKAYLEENMPQRTRRTEHKSILDELLSADIITQTEYDAMKAAMPTPGRRPDVERPEPGERSDGERPKIPDRLNPFDRFVEDGTISRQTANAINEHLKSQAPDRIEVNVRIDIFSKMLEDGVITQAEYDAIKAATPERPLDRRPKN